MNMFDEARSFRDMMNARRITQKKLAEFLGVSQPYIANKLRLLGFSPRHEKMINDLGLSERHARTVLRLKEERDRETVLRKCTERYMTVVMLEAAVEEILCDSFVLSGDTFSARGKISDFMDKVDSALALLRSYGIRARTKYDESENDLYMSIHIEK